MRFNFENWNLKDDETGQCGEEEEDDERMRRMGFRRKRSALPSDGGGAGAHFVVDYGQLYRPDQTAATPNAEEDR